MVEVTTENTEGKIQDALNCISASDGEVDPRGFHIGVDQHGWYELGGHSNVTELQLIGKNGLLKDKLFRVLLIKDLPLGRVCFIWQ